MSAYTKPPGMDDRTYAKLVSIFGEDEINRLNPVQQLLHGWDWLTYSSKVWRRKTLAEYGNRIPESLRELLLLAPVTNRKTLVTPPLALQPIPRKRSNNGRRVTA